ncbi:MAG: hypothetical protein QOG33_114 [Gaiellales bacterium]|jgi:hypothetical protein|nr:hypothetical protein [Gaiellales bacterium]
MIHHLYPGAIPRAPRSPGRETEHELFMRLAEEQRRERRRQRRGHTVRAIRRATQLGRPTVR